MGSNGKKIAKWVFGVLLAVLVIVTIVYAELIVYGLRQGYGQATIIWKAKPIENFLADENFPDSLKMRLRLIQEVREYAIDSLGLRDTDNYKTMFDQQGKEIMWVVLACEPFALVPKEWKFPIVGSVPYKGFFNKERAITLKDELEQEGWDVIIRNPGGWSTLGWFTDPILSKMLNRSEGDLANLIIHEMSHATIFVKDSVDFNENLATFIGDRGAEKFLLYKYGRNSSEYQTYMQEDRDYIAYSAHMLRGALVLDSVYAAIQSEPIERKRIIKEKAIRAIVQFLDTLQLSTAHEPSKRFSQMLPNNAYFMNFRQYQEKQVIFGDELTTKFDDDLVRYIQYLSEAFPFL